MSWKSQYRQASFRGVAFHVPSHSANIGGRRTAVHEYPGRDVPLVEDMGKQSASFSIEAYVIGDEYMVQRDALIDACGEAGSGELVHPYLGTLTVICNGCNFSERADEGRMVRFSLSFHETGKNTFPTTTIDSSRVLINTTDSFLEQLLDVFIDSYVIAGQPSFVAESARSLFTQVTDTLMAASGLSSNPILRRAGRLFVDALDELIFAAEDVGSNFIALIESGGAEDINAEGWMSALESMSGSADSFETIPSTTAARAVEATNATAIAQLVQGMSVAGQLKVLPSLDIATSTQAFALLDALMARLDALEEYASEASPESSPLQLHAVRTSMADHIRERAPKLSELTSFSLSQSEPALVTSHRLYQNANRAEEIVARNYVPHPSFMPAGQNLEVVAND